MFFPYTPQSLRDSPPNKVGSFIIAPPHAKGQLRPNRKQLGSEATEALKGCPVGVEG
jgi:hypothetical protein